MRLSLRRVSNVFREFPGLPDHQHSTLLTCVESHTYISKLLLCWSLHPSQAKPPAQSLQPTMANSKESAATVVTQLEHKAAAIESKIEEKLTYLWHEIAPWQRDNAYITSGYRPASNSYAKSWASLFYIHNETVNIYTHLLGAVFFFVASYFLYGELRPRYETANREDLWVFGCFFAGAVACLGMSGTYHTISNHSHEVAVWGNKLDYLGIVFLIWGSFIPVLYYAFEEEPGLRKTYWTMVRIQIPCLSRGVSRNAQNPG